MLFVCENLFGMKTLNLHRKNVIPVDRTGKMYLLVWIRAYCLMISLFLQGIILLLMKD